MSVLNAHNLVATVVDLLKVSWRGKIEGELQLIILSIKLDKMLDGAQRF